MAYKQSILMAVGTVINSLLGLVFYVAIGRILGVEGFGQLSYYLGVGWLTAELADLGVNSSIVKFGSENNFSKIIKLAIKQRISIFLAIFIVFSILSKNLDQFLIYSAAVATCTLLSYFTVQSLIAKEKFALQIGANILGNLGRLIGLGTLGITGLVTPISGIVLVCLGGGITFLAGIPVIISGFRTVGKSDDLMEFEKSVWKFALPAAGSFSLASLSSRLDIPILYVLAGPVAVGVYSSAQKLASVIPQVSAAIDSVFAPKFVKNTLGVLRQYLAISALAVLGLIFGVFISDFAIGVFGPDYAPASAIFKIILISYIPFFFAGPFAGKVLYGYGKSNYHLLTSAIALIVSLLCYYFLVPMWSGIGAAITAIIVNFVIWLVYLFIYYILSHGS